VALSAPTIYLLFVDDMLLFFRVDGESAQEVLSTYCQASGQQINMDKSSIHFPKGCSQSLRDKIKNTLEVHNEAPKEKYLGMPSDVGSVINGAFKFLKDRVWNRVQRWMEQCLSISRRKGSSYQSGITSNSNLAKPVTLESN
jgi:hypothetical protein